MRTACIPDRSACLQLHGVFGVDRDTQVVAALNINLGGPFVYSGGPYSATAANIGPQPIVSGCLVPTPSASERLLVQLLKVGCIVTCSCLCASLSCCAIAVCQDHLPDLSTDGSKQLFLFKFTADVARALDIPAARVIVNLHVRDLLHLRLPVPPFSSVADRLLAPSDGRRQRHCRFPHQLHAFRQNTHELAAAFKAQVPCCSVHDFAPSVVHLHSVPLPC